MGGSSYVLVVQYMYKQMRQEICTLFKYSFTKNLMTVNVQRIWDFKGPLARVSMANLDIEVRDSTRLTRT